MDGWENLKVHPYAAIVPKMLPRKFEELKESLGQRGQYDPIIVSREDPPRIIDGRHRLWALKELGVEPTFALLEEGLDELEFILDKEEAQKELTKSQKATFGYLLSRLSPVGRPRATDENCEDLPIYTQEDAAKRVGVSRKLIGLVKRVMESDSPVVEAVGEALSQGKVTVNDCLEFVVQPADVQIPSMEMLQSGKAKTLAKATAKIIEEMTLSSQGPDSVHRPREVNDNLITIIHSTMPELVSTVDEHSIDVIITSPSADPGQLNRLDELHDFSIHALAPTGIVAVIVDPRIMPLVMVNMMQSGLQFVAEMAIVSDSPLTKTPQPHSMTYYHSPVLIFGKEDYRMERGGSVLRVPSQEGGQLIGVRRLLGMVTELVMERVAKPRQRVCDPNMLDRPHTARAALKLGCTFIGASHNSGCVDGIRKALCQGGR